MYNNLYSLASIATIALNVGNDLKSVAPRAAIILNHDSIFYKNRKSKFTASTTVRLTIKGKHKLTST